MSHASLIVALSPEEIVDHGGVEEALAWNMAPFHEGGEWFQDGSRWDWYQIGGGFTGRFFPDYDPRQDPRNIEICRFCHGTGKRTDMEVQDGCNGCRGTGKMLKWPMEWAPFDGDAVKRSEVEHLAENLFAFAFLKHRCWREAGRLGWFGMSADTECEVQAREETGEEYTGRCVRVDEETGAKIVTWQEVFDEGRWTRLFWARFIRNLPPDTTLVVVDYHV